MNRKTFFKRITLASGAILITPGAFGRENTLFDLNQTRTSRGLQNEVFIPKIRKAPWGQKVFYDHYTYLDMHRAMWLKEGLSYAEIEPKVKEIEDTISSGELVLRKGPAKLLNGLWLLDVDGQQNTYLLESNDGLILIDPGMITTTGIIVRQIQELGFPISAVKNVLLTHCHLDHAQSAHFWEEKGAEIFIHNEEQNAIQTGNEITAWWLGKGEHDRLFPPVKEVTPFYDGDMLKLGEHKIFICHTPGHTPGSSCFYIKKDDKHILISGDTIFHNGKHGWMGHPYSDYDDYIKSLWKLKRFAVEGTVHNEQDRIMVREPIHFDILLPGHTAISYSDVNRDIDKSIEIMSYTIQQRRKGKDYQWTEPYTFFAEREILGLEPIQLEYR